jgi:asparagine synthase (glutamine-hydrolysing)
MCGISGLFGRDTSRLDAMVRRQHHRGPDSRGTYVDPAGSAALGHNRLSIIDLSDAGRQPMASADGRYWIAFNGEIYNYLELRQQLADYPFQSHTDTEVVLAAYDRWGPACLQRFIGMFALLIWDQQQHRLFAARDRFGVKPLYYHRDGRGGLAAASEIKALHAGGVPAEADAETWAAFLVHGLYDHSERTFWKDIVSLPPGHFLTWQDHQLRVGCWYDLAEAVGVEYDQRPEEAVSQEYLALLQESVALRFRSDVTVAVNLSGGLDSSLLLGLIHQIQGPDSEVRVFTFATGDCNYDELPWVEQMLARTRHPLTVGMISPADVPQLAERISEAQDEPFGGLPTLAYANLFARARQEGVTVLLDGQGMDEAWAGYDYYTDAMQGDRLGSVSTVQGTSGPISRADCLVPEFRALAPPQPAVPEVFPDPLRRLQYRDARLTKLPRALRFNDRVSMASSTELREPFLDHRLFELALKQPAERKRDATSGKRLLRKIAGQLLPDTLREAPKRPLQTPQREWLRGPLARWAGQWIEAALDRHGDRWLSAAAVRAQWSQYQRGESDNSFFVWQWISLGLSDRLAETRAQRSGNQ